MGRKLTLKVIRQGTEKIIRVRENLTIKNLKIIIRKELKLEGEEIKALGKENELADHQKLKDTEVKDGDEIVIEDL